MTESWKRITPPRRAALTASLALGIVSQLSTSFAQVVQDRTVSSVTASDNGACATVSIKFNVPIRYQSHFPAMQGRELRVAVAPLSFVRGSTPFGAESVRPPESRVAGIQQITYDLADPTGPTLVLLFDHEAHWTVEADKDATRLVIRVSPDSQTCVAQGPKGAASGATSASNAILSVTQTIPDGLEPNGNYSVNLASDRGRKLQSGTIKPIDLFSKYAAYTTNTEENGVSWARMRLGMFATRADAEQILTQVQSTYPDAWIVRLDRSERDMVYQAWLAARAQLSGSAPGASQLAPVNAEAEKMLDEVRAHLAAGENADAVRVASAILGLPDSAATPAAQEMLGLAREKAGQLAHAKAEYETFLQRFPDNEAAPRVRQRLAALLSAGDEQSAPNQTDKPAARKKARGRGGISGSLSALYQRDQSTVIFKDTPVVGAIAVDPVQDDRTNLNEVLYGVDLNASGGTDRTTAQVRFSGQYRDDFRTLSPSDQGAVSALYLDVSDRGLGSSLRLGRQTRNTGGVFGRFDGALASVQAGDRLKFNAVTGFPVQSSRDLKVGTDRRFVGTSLDASLIPSHLDATVYFLEQTFGNLLDRQAAGLEFRYFDASNTAYGIFDYDTHYGKLNLGLVNGTVRFKDNSSVSLAIDYRRAPLLTTLNAVFGQGFTDPNDLSPTYTHRQIYQLAEDRTAYSRSASLSIAKTLTDKLQANIDIIATNVSGTKASGGIEAQPGTGTEYYYSAQLVGSDFLRPGAIFITGIRYADLQANYQYTFQTNLRIPITTKLRVSPKLRIDYREHKDGTASDTSGRGSADMIYNLDRMLQFEAEIGAQFSNSDTTFGTSKETGYFVTLGVRRDF